MKKRVRFFAFILWAAILCAGCTGAELLSEIPKDFMLSQGEAKGASEEAVPVGMSGVFLEEEEEKEEEQPQECFLMEEAFSFACDRLSEAEQIWYHDIEQILGGFGAEVPLSPEGIAAGLNEDNIDRIFQCVLNDHPELFYVDGYAYTKHMWGGRLSSVVFSGNYFLDPDTALERREEIQAAAGEILDGVEADASDYDKVKYVYDTLIRSTDYDINAPDNQNIYSVFAHHLSVCQGYAKATQYLLNKLGVECALVLGTVETGEGHAWNLVRVDGDYYYVDTTWGDVSYQMEEDSEEASDSGEKDVQIAIPEINYDYLNVTTEEILRTHSIDSEVPMPLCVATEANYYLREGALFTSYDREQMEALFQKRIVNGQGDVTVKCADAVCYDEILDMLIGEQEIFDYMADGESTVAYAQNEKQLSLTFWVTNK